jgi:hypothetical protein
MQIQPHRNILTAWSRTLTLVAVNFESVCLNRRIMYSSFSGADMIVCLACHFVHCLCTIVVFVDLHILFDHCIAGTISCRRIIGALLEKKAFSLALSVTQI